MFVGFSRLHRRDCRSDCAARQASIVDWIADSAMAAGATTVDVPGNGLQRWSLSERGSPVDRRRWPDDFQAAMKAPNATAAMPARIVSKSRMASPP